MRTFIPVLAGILLSTGNWQAQASIGRNAQSLDGSLSVKPSIEAESRFSGNAGLNLAPTQSQKPVMLAHAILVKASPERESTISDAPDEVSLLFHDSVGQEFLALAVIDPTGKRVDNHDAKLDFTDHSHLRASVSKLSPGRYTVRYRVLSADGHVVSGKYFFDVQGK